VGTIDVELFDQEKPITVTNFLGIVNRGDYDNTFFHRSVPGFIVQGGGFQATFPSPVDVPTVDPITNEPGISNTRGTIAMAKTSDPDSATTQWFFNLADNSASLDDPQNSGGFTAFGRVLGNGMSVVDAMAALPIVNAGGVFSDLPVIDAGASLTNENLVILESITVLGDDPGPDPGPDPDPGSTSLYFPVLPQGADGFNGLALLNRSSDSVQLELELLDNVDGSTAMGTLEIEPGVQVAQLVSEIFGENTAAPAWIRFNSEGTQLASFFQFGKSDLSQLDGGVAVSKTTTTLYFTRVFDGTTAFRGQSATTTLSILNPNSTSVILRLTYVSPTGNQILVLQINPNSFLFDSASELFGANLSGGYIKAEVIQEPGVIQEKGVVGFEIIELPDSSTVLGLNAALENTGSQLFSAQLAIQEGLFTSLNLVNTASDLRSVTLTAVDSDGASLGDPVVMSLEAGAQVSQDARVLFGGQDFTGSLRVDSDGPGVVGDVIFGDASNLDFAASLPLQAESFREAIFSQVANGMGFFTGVALFNPGTEDALFTLEVFSSAGESVGQTSPQTLEAGRRVSQLVDEFVPASAGQVGGFVTIVSDQPLVGQMLFGVSGAEGVTLFSAVPPTVVE
jgi:cyclophilin family peptidyl-prolyl cis-trans isomerase